MIAQQPSPVDGRSARRVDTRAAILAAATRLFAANGISATSLDDVAAAAGIAKGSIFYNFGSKHGLVSELIDDYANRLENALNEATVGLTGSAALRAVVATLLRSLEEHTDAARVLLSEMFRTDRTWLAGIERWRQVGLRTMLDAMLDADPEADRASTSLRAAAMIGATLVAGLNWLVFNPELDYERVLDAVEQTLGLGEPGDR
ncbi:TetR/AcrR family transcriptional regulator [Brooklawnia cerclae]|uniref:AcrR family transcriptional regulator n=1 Tax=Brooklawnia cerclae TaxID=349934 RepID=A0ABX0SFY2_9ACTN|nr:TetR/AcrR family transcriptional regulator [Brooklawnia cerclae]NIH55541.1 AcrR family transcriptional regulator [Brooklawnia cerclae]